MLDRQRMPNMKAMVEHFDLAFLDLRFAVSALNGSENDLDLYYVPFHIQQYLEKIIKAVRV
jgi:hypothetical protein